MDDRKSIIDRVIEARDATVSRVQQGVHEPDVSATKERAEAVRHRAQTAALSQLHLATREDVAGMQASLDRIEAAVNDLAKRLPEAKPARPRATRAKPEDSQRLARRRHAEADRRRNDLEGRRRNPRLLAVGLDRQRRLRLDDDARARLKSALGWFTWVPR